MSTRPATAHPSPDPSSLPGRRSGGTIDALRAALLILSLGGLLALVSGPAQAATITRTFAGQRRGAQFSFRLNDLAPGSITAGWLVVDGIRRPLGAARLKAAASHGGLRVSVDGLPAARHVTSVLAEVRTKLVIQTRSAAGRRKGHPRPVKRAPAPAPPAPAPVTTTPVTPAPVTTTPVTPAPVATTPVTTTPVTTTPVTTAPVTITPVTTAPVTTAPVTTTPVTTTPVTTTPPPAGGPVGVAMPAVPASALYVSPSGSDSNPGTQQAPWRTLAKATSAAQPGQTVVLEPGVYGAQGVRTDWTASGTASAPITFIGDPTASTRPTILGYNVLYGSHVQVFNLLFDGPTGSVDPPTSTDPTGQEVMLWLTAPDIEIADSEIRNSLWHAGIYLTNANGDQLIGNYIHNNGNPDDPTQANLDHGIYWGEGTGGLIADNVITDNVAMGIQLYPTADNVTVEWNTIAGNGKSGVIIAQDSANNTVTNNIVADNADNSIRSFDLTGTNNLVTNNIVWQNGSGNLGQETDGLTLTNNTQTSPDFTPGTYTLTPNSPATGVAGADQTAPSNL